MSRPEAANVVVFSNVRPLTIAREDGRERPDGVEYNEERERETIRDICEDDIPAGQPPSRGDDDEQSDDDGEAPGGAARSFGFTPELLNRKYSLVLLGSKAVVFMDQPEAPADDQQRVLTLDALGISFANKFTERLGLGRQGQGRHLGEGLAAISQATILQRSAVSS